MNLKKIFFSILLTIIFIEKSHAVISDALFMTIGDKAVTQSDIVAEIKTLLILNNESYSQDKRDQLHKIAVNSIIKRKVKEIEIGRNNFFNYNPIDLENEIKRLAQNLNINVDTLKNICSSNDLDFARIEHNIKVDLAWNSLIFQIYKDKLTINPDEIDEQLKSIENKNEIIEYLISEIITEPVENDKVDSTITELKKKIKIEGFENVAKKLSISETAVKGGDLGWVNENAIARRIKREIINTPMGEISSPILLPEGILIFKVRNKRKVETKLNLETKKNELVKMEKIKILNMHSLSHYDKVRRSVSIKFLQ